MSSFIISHFSYCPLIWVFCSGKSTKKINAVHERSLRIILNDYESLHSLLLEEAHQITFHRWCVNSLMIEVYKYLNRHYERYFQIKRKYTYNLRNFHIFQTANPRSLKYGLDAIPYRASQLCQQVFIDFPEAASLSHFKNCINCRKYKDFPYRSCKVFIQNVEYIWLGLISNWW